MSQMTLQECYAAMGGDYEGVLGRLRSERMVQKFVLKFLADPSYDNLVKAMAEENYDEAFRAAHTIKGVGQNLDFTKLYKSSDELCEAMRGGVKPTDDNLFERVKADYAQTISAIKEFESSVQ